MLPTIKVFLKNQKNLNILIVQAVQSISTLAFVSSFLEILFSYSNCPVRIWKFRKLAYF